MNKLKRNLAYQTVYQVLVTITPLITAPYLARVLGAEKLGVYSYTLSIVNYFTLVAMLGLTNYGTRAIAMAKTKKQQDKAFSEIYTIQLATSVIASIFYFIVVLLIRQNTTYMLLQSFWLLSCIFDITWYFFGREEFKTTVTRNIIIKILSIICIFVFVKNENDISKYIAIMSLSTFISQIYLWAISKKTVSFKLATKKQIKKHIKPILTLFVPVLAMSVFRIMDKTMLGALSSEAQSGYYYNADKVVNIPLGIITGLGTVMLSRVSSLRLELGDSGTINFVKKYFNYLLCASIAMGFGIAAISSDFVPLFFGDGYEQCIELIQLFSIVIVAKTISDIIRTQYLIPFKKEKVFVRSVILGCIVNLIANLIFLKVFNMGAKGATLGTIIAEITVAVAQLTSIVRNEKFLPTLLLSLYYIIPGAIMFIAVIALSKTLSLNLFAKISIEIIVGASIYVLLSAPYFYYSNKRGQKHIK